MFGNQIFEKQFFFSVFSFLSATAKIGSGIRFPPKAVARALHSLGQNGDKMPRARSAEVSTGTQVRVDWLWLPGVQA